MEYSHEFGILRHIFKRCSSIQSIDNPGQSVSKPKGKFPARNFFAKKNQKFPGKLCQYVFIYKISADLKMIIYALSMKFIDVILIYD
jgi:hypothetical protein